MFTVARRMVDAVCDQIAIDMVEIAESDRSLDERQFRTMELAQVLTILHRAKIQLDIAGLPIVK